MDTDFNEYEQEHIQNLDQYLSECMVLLRKNGDFPLNSNEKQVYLFGNGIRNTIKGGTGSGEVNSHSFIIIEEAFIKGVEILSKEYLDSYNKVYEKAKKDFKKKLQHESFFHPIQGIIKSMGAVMPEPEYNIPYNKEGDIAIYVLSRISGEGSDRQFVKGDVLLTETEKNTITTLANGYKKFMLVLNTGGPVDLSGLEEVKNILLLSQLGVNTSKALVDVIYGKKYPSGKLATTWTKQEDYQTPGDFGNSNDTNYNEGIYVGYRYFDSADIDVMFPFGFGLGYTDFNYDLTSVELNGDIITINTKVKNIGNYQGKEVLEVYLSKPHTTLDEPYQILVAFAKTKQLDAGEEDNLSLRFKLSDFASYDQNEEAYILDEGAYIVRLGNSSRNTKPCAEIQVQEKIIVRKVQNKLGNSGFIDSTFESKKKDEDLSNVSKFTLDKNCIKKEDISYNKSFNISEEVKSLTTEDKVKLVVGAFNPKGGMTGFLGGTPMAVAGAAGETAKVADLKPIVMADGPAGLRLAKDYYVNKDGGAHSTEGGLPVSLVENFPGIIRFALKMISPKPDKNAPISHQYTTAIPIGTALAQSWNRDLAECCGDIVGDEMERFGVHLWLAPALNIHRNILCGRNFEYFSEDPLISGIMAAAITKGVQKHKHTYTTLKHFSANNQEHNRYFNSSNVSERALREIYLKSFEIAIRETKPKALMTSYNLINGIHTNESHELVSDILRNEFGYDGIVMTDWIVAMGMTAEKNNKYQGPSASKVIKATGDIFMPGCYDDYKDILKALENGTLTMEELETSATRIYELAKEIKT
ncbi:beta-glucosidase-related glycosidase [Piromyces finnis]|uniref:beta-glucosidase n=1 Tax=Piromyces finnis TaxID=1754191 RepID=A0A1Y1VC31_9FUNG|nr:beta-glucosidase-related glycosidase [Piromyces finnis]|eukprot:ORX52221.1 beta-glucosidase-related glycosidase [Piromyces finnis]